MSNYIDSDRIDLKNYLMHKDGKALYSDDFFAGIKWVLDRIDEMPSIDIVRCGECKHCDKGSDRVTGQTVFICQRKNDENLWEKMNADDFCSYGSRSEKPNNLSEISTGSERSSE